MVRSMTGFGRAKETVGDLTVTVEFKAVNHRYFEFSSRIPRVYGFLDEKLSNLCKQRVTRGKIEASVLIEDNSQSSAVVEINSSLAEAYIGELKKTAKKYGLKNDVKVSSLIGLPDMFKVRQQQLSDETVTEAVLKVAELALDAFVAMREKEGEKLFADVSSRADYILKKVEFVENRSPETVKEYREKIEQKIKELLGDIKVDEQRLLTETAVFADKVAVAEETVRLRSHISQLLGLMETPEAVGRKLDFIVQEMNREANTIGSKAQDIDIAHTVVDIKSEIEKIREQIQNIE
ncbi:MAG: YicC family protein [Clostridia bacterium]|nr:YicC family protein [Clostridia bacterium]